MTAPGISKESAIVAYQALDIPETYANKPQSFSVFCEMLDLAESRFKDLSCPLSPTSFDSRDHELRGYPRPVAWRWASAERSLQALECTGVMMRRPLFWQVESPLFAAGQAAGAPIYASDQNNMPLAAAAIRGAGMNTVVTDAEDAARFSGYLKDSSALSPAWIIIHPISAKAWTIPEPLKESDVGIYQEVHLFPGVALLDQCDLLAQKKDPVFHVSDDFCIDTNSGNTRITSAIATPLPLYQYEVPVQLRHGGICSCEKVLYERQ